MNDSSRDVSGMPPSGKTRFLSQSPDKALAAPPIVTEADLAEAWFDEPPPSTRRSSAPPPPVSVVGEFIGDDLADAWLR